jgi:hypothetical protein
LKKKIIRLVPIFDKIMTTIMCQNFVATPGQKNMRNVVHVSVSCIQELIERIKFLSKTMLSIYHFDLYSPWNPCTCNMFLVELPVFMCSSKSRVDIFMTTFFNFLCVTNVKRNIFEHEIGKSITVIHRV